VFAVWLPEPLTVATWIEKSFVVAVNGILASKLSAWQQTSFTST